VTLMNRLTRTLTASLCAGALLGGLGQAQAQTADQPRELRVFNWADYMLPSVP
jgi:putrescine transport system substrate-binding protein